MVQCIRMLHKDYAVRKENFAYVRVGCTNSPAESRKRKFDLIFLGKILEAVKQKKGRKKGSKKCGKKRER